MAADESREANAMSGTMRQLVNNMVSGVTKGFEKKLALVGVGYRATAQGNKLNLRWATRTLVNIEMPAGVKVETPDADRNRDQGRRPPARGPARRRDPRVRPPEPYKGKGIRYADEKVVDQRDQEEVRRPT